MSFYPPSKLWVINLYHTIEMPSITKRNRRNRRNRKRKTQKRGGMNRVGRAERERPPNYEQQRHIAARNGYGRLRAQNLAPPNNRLRRIPVRPLAPLGIIPDRPNNIEDLDIIAIESDNAVNAVTFEDIRFDQPVLVIDNEHRYQRVYQSNDSIADLRQTMRNPHTRNPIRSAVWMKPVRM